MNLWHRFRLDGGFINQAEFGVQEPLSLRECALMLVQFAARTENYAVAPLAVDLLMTAKAAEPNAFTTEHQKVLAVARHQMYKHTGRTADLRLAIHKYRLLIDQTVAGQTPDADLLMALGTALYEAFDQGLPEGDLDEALAIFRGVLAGDLPEELRSFLLNNTADVLRRRGSDAEIDEAVTLYRDALAWLAPNHPIRARIEQNLETLVKRRSPRSTVESADPMTAALGRLQLNQCDALMAMPNRTQREARLRAAWARSESPPPISAADTLFDTILQLTWHLASGDRSEAIGRLESTVGDAAAVYLEAEMPERAVEILELGRGLQWSQLSWSRAELARLHKCRPDLARTLTEIMEGMETGFDISVPLSMERRPKRAEWDKLLDTVRRIEGFERFLTPLSYAEIAPAGERGPIVMINISALRCDALILDQGVLRVVPLPCTADQCTESMTKLAVALALLEYPGALDDDAWSSVNATVLAVLRWLGQAVVEPVLRSLTVNHTCVPNRVWWCPTGILTLAPLHAAEMTDDGHTRSLLDVTTSSYVTSLRSQLPAERPSPGLDQRLLMVSVPQALTGPLLPSVQRETRTVLAQAPCQVTHLAGPAATIEGVLAQVGSHTWLHLACHGGRQAVRRTDSGRLNYHLASAEGLRLADGELEPQRLARLDLSHVQLAVLTACKTSTPDMHRPDEAVHMAGALRAAGCRQVVAALWSISDHLIPEFTAEFYTRLTTANRVHLDPAGAAATQQAAQALRENYPEYPILWAPFIHLGA